MNKNTLFKVTSFIVGLSVSAMANSAPLATSLVSNSNNIEFTADNTSTTRAMTQTEQLLTNQPNKQRTLADGLQQLNHNNYHFTIYSAETKLVNDYDADGYFQTFTVTFDADLLSYSLFQQASVYAELYLSVNGGAWQHYLTTDIFTLYGDSSDDKYSIYTRLNQGYLSGEYDVLIDLYEVGYHGIVASYSGYDDAALAALPLESDEYDIVYGDDSQVHTDVHIHGGTTYWLLLTCLFIVIIIRKQLTVTKVC